MRNLLLLIISVVCFTSARAQQVFPAYSDNPEWKTSNCDMAWGAPGGVLCNTGTFAYTGQATICGELYNQVNNYFYVREAAGKVFIRKSADCNEREYLLYDFTIQPTDTVYTGFALNTGSNIDSVAYIMTSFETDYFFGQQRRIYNMITSRTGEYPYPDTVQWIEGIGSTLHPFHAIICWADPCESFYSTLCAFSDGQQTYGGTGANACEVMSRGNELEKLSVKLYPNPATSQITLTLPASDAPYSMSLVDLTGRIVYSSKDITALNQSEYTVSLPAVPAGVYLVQVSNEIAQAYLKLIVE